MRQMKHSYVIKVIRDDRVEVGEIAVDKSVCPYGWPVDPAARSALCDRFGAEIIRSIDLSELR